MPRAPEQPLTTSLARIVVYPIKSLDGAELDEVAVLASGALEGDRQFALVDDEGQFVTGKRTAAVHAIRAEYDLVAQQVHLCKPADPSSTTFPLAAGDGPLAEWLSDALGIACRVVEDRTHGFPDDTEAPGPTLISTAALCAVAAWFPGLTLEEARRRFRANLEVDGVEPFWEDRLVGPFGTEVPFRVGPLQWLGAKACRRCVVPTRSSQAAEVTRGFQRRFAAERKRSLPEWAARERFDHFYRVAVNTRLAPGQPIAMLRRGDVVRLA